MIEYLLKRFTFKRLLCAGLAIVLMCSLAGCGDKQSISDDLMKDFKPGTSSQGATSGAGDPQNPETPSAGEHSGGAEYLYEDGATAVTAFGVDLFRKSFEADKNTLISPLSVISALGMTANGAVNETLAEMEAVFGISVEELNHYLKGYREALPEGEKYKLSLANGIWFKDAPSFTVVDDFLQTNADYYEAGLYKAPFDDSTKKEINQWVEENTDGLIKNILDEIPEDAIMYLVNALAFDAQWQTIYKENQIRDGEFTREDGTLQKVEMMYSEESKFLEDESAQGFLKYYADRKYAFAALLPNEGVTVEQYVETLTGEKLRQMLTNPKSITVRAAIPKFESEYSVEMSDVLKTMGMQRAFDGENADFTGLGESLAGNIFINRVLHKTFIAVDEKGTKAGAATVVEMVTESARMEPEEVKTVYLDRPFVYMIIDCENSLPVFIGAVTDLGQ